MYHSISFLNNTADSCLQFLSTIIFFFNTEKKKQMNESSFTGAGGLKIFTRSWCPAAGAPRGVVVIVPGFNSHSGYYEWVADQLVSEDLAVYSLDLRGRGKSDGERFYVQKFE